MEVDTPYSAIDQNSGFLGVGTTLDIFQNIIVIPYFEYGVLSLSGYGVLSFIPEWSLVWKSVEYGVSKCWIRRIGDFLDSATRKDTTINKLRNHIKSLRESDKKDGVKQDMDEIEIINIELEHNLKGQIQEKIFVTTALQNELRRLKDKNVLDNATTLTNATIIAPGMFKLDIELISHRLKNNRDTYEDYLKKTIENIDTIRGLELLVYVSKTCPSLTKSSEKLVAVTPKNKEKKVRFADPVTSSNNTQKQVDSHKTKDSNQPLLHSTGVICSTSASGSNPTGNTKNNRILQS
ncbi:hypothetical protein Tco_1569042 [Tanacetum coccineum]